MAKLKKFLLWGALIFFGAVLIINPARYTKVCFTGICLWAESVLPSLFPFMIITLLLIKTGAVQAFEKPIKKTGKISKFPKHALPLFVMSVCSGYPAGSKILCEYCDMGKISDSEVKTLAPLCSACGPLFALGTVGNKAFGGGYAGVKLLFACLTSVILTWFIYCLFPHKTKPIIKPAILPQSNERALYACFSGGVNACLIAGGFICFFYTLSCVCADLHIFTPLQFLLAPIFGQGVANGICQGLVEATGGCFEVAKHGGFFALPSAGFLMTFGGASILLQQLCYLNKCGVKSLYFIVFKFVQGAVSFGILCLLSLF